MKSSHLQIHPQLAQVLHEVVGERIVVIQNQNHFCAESYPKTGKMKGFRKVKNQFALATIRSKLAPGSKKTSSL